MSGIYGKEGFTAKPEIRKILEKHIIDRLGDAFYFDALPAGKAKKLLDLLPPANRRDGQNDSPTFATLVKWGQEFPKIYYHGYCVLPPRNDERISLTGFYCPPSVAPKLLRRCRIKPDDAEVIQHPKLGEVFWAWWD